MLGAALLFDLGYGEYPAPAHPVVWLGSLAGRVFGWAPATGALRRFLFGAAATLFLVVLFTAPVVWLLQGLYLDSGLVPYLLAGSLALKPAFSLRYLLETVAAVRARLAEGDLPAARSAVSAIVSRDTSWLSPGQVAAAAIGSAAENFNDSFVAPLCYFAVFGPAGAVAYRVVNTLDAMVGYRGEFEHLGKAAARLDDLLNFVPARISGLLLAASAGIGGGSVAGALGVMWRDHRRTASPNAGWPMGAMAGALERRLEKPDHYVLGGAAPEPDAADILRALVMVGAAAALVVLLVALVVVVRFGR